jgi:hypothetical protein
MITLMVGYYDAIDRASLNIIDRTDSTLYHADPRMLKQV